MQYSRFCSKNTKEKEQDALTCKFNKVFRNKKETKNSVTKFIIHLILVFGVILLCKEQGKKKKTSLFY